MWPEIKDQVTEFVIKCDICQKIKIFKAKIHEPMVITDTPLDSLDKISLDTGGKVPDIPDGNKHILTKQDNLCKYCIVVSITNICTTTFVHTIADYLFSQYGPHEAILTNRGESF